MTWPGRTEDTALAASWPIWSTTARLVVREPAALAAARNAVESELAGMQAAASRFDPTSEVSRLAMADGAPTQISPLLARTIRAALRVAELTDGAVDPTLGRALIDAGYDEDISVVTNRPRRLWAGSRVSTVRRTTWRDVRLVGDVVQVPAGVLLDLGATGKALAVDRAATRASIAADGPVLVAVGGDLRAVTTEREPPWLIEIAETPEGAGQAWVHVVDGGVATSSTTSRRWRQGWHWSHHVLDPTTGRSATEHWRTATVAAQTCVDANAASTAVLVKGSQAASWLEEQQLPARLVHRGGGVRLIAGWPAQEAA